MFHCDTLIPCMHLAIIVQQNLHKLHRSMCCPCTSRIITQMGRKLTGVKQKIGNEWFMLEEPKLIHDSGHLEIIESFVNFKFYFRSQGESKWFVKQELSNQCSVSFIVNTATHFELTMNSELI